MNTVDKQSTEVVHQEISQQHSCSGASQGDPDPNLIISTRVLDKSLQELFFKPALGNTTPVLTLLKVIHAQTLI